MGQVVALTAAGSLTSQEAELLTFELSAVQQALDQGNTRLASAELRIYIATVNVMLRRGLIDQATADALIAPARQALSLLG